MEANNANQSIVHPESSFKVMGACFNVYNELGWGLSEKQYQQALAKEFTDRGIRFRREVFIPLEYKQVNVGRYFADLVVEGKILLELKVVSVLGYIHAKQVLGYLRGGNLRIGILVYFTKEGVKYRRILNIRES
ncbi:MAG: GxxExxY protein [Candidatus Liptonbacteria bacterium]|nr:GxxExxY protein [Candidatus Liptonbacteria bacterium]